MEFEGTISKHQGIILRCRATLQELSSSLNRKAKLDLNKKIRLSKKELEKAEKDLKK